MATAGIDADAIVTAVTQLVGASAGAGR
jgi:hypothetical protein